MSKLSEMVDSINDRLESFGEQAVQSKPAAGRTETGYKPQYVIDAVNEIIGPENWSYERVGEFDKQKWTAKPKNGSPGKEKVDVSTIVNVIFKIKNDDTKGMPPYEYVSTGPQAGGSVVDVERGNWTDAYKSAITNAVMKCLARFSVGSIAYRGCLKASMVLGDTTAMNKNDFSETSNNALPEIDDTGFEEFLD